MAQPPVFHASEEEAKPVARCGHVAIVGRPNVGKSTLLNHLVGQKISITSRKPQTTRHRLRGILTTDDAQFVFVDTPGFQTRHTSALNTRLNQAATHALREVDVIVMAFEPLKLGSEDRNLIAFLPKGVPTVAVVTKIDKLADKSVLLPFLQQLSHAYPFTALIPLSAQKNVQLDSLLAEVQKHLPFQPPLFAREEITDRDERFLAAELVREKIFRQFGNEVPYATTVVIERFEVRNGLRHINALVLVDKASQRPIILGEAGARMKAIATQARHDMETLFEGPVYLEVFVRVKSGWAESDRMLKELGF